jgi:hypothetical protein
MEDISEVIDKILNKDDSDTWKKSLASLGLDGLIGTTSILGQKLYLNNALVPEFLNTVGEKNSPKGVEAGKFINFLKDNGLDVKTIKSYKNNAGFAPLVRNPGSKGAILHNSSQLPSAPVLAHEYGHAKNFSDLRDIIGHKPAVGLSLLRNLVGNNITPASTGIALFSSAAGADDNVVLGAGLVGTAASLPQVIEETLASARGAHTLGKLNMSDKFKSFVGLPTYIASAATPMIPYLSDRIVDYISKKDN